MRDYPTEAVREALLNAIVHREYSFSNSTLISIFDDRIEFVTIGGLVKGVSLEDVELGVSVLRNEHLANIFYQLMLIEAHGTGIAKVRRSYAGAAVQPQIEVTNNAFKITLPNMNCERSESTMIPENLSSAVIVVPKEDRVNFVLKMCREKGSVTRKEVQEALQVSQATAILLLKKMVEEGVIIKSGAGKEIRYFEKE